MATSYFQDRVSSPTGGSTNSILSPTSPSAQQSTPRSNALQNRITSVLSASFADLEIRDALSILDERHLTNTAEARRNLRLDVQGELIKSNGGIIQDFGQVAAQLKRIGTAIHSLDASCAEMRKHINAANRETGPMLEEAKTILDGKRQVEQKQQVLDAFTTHFVLSESDLATLTSTAEPVTDAFFDLFARLQKIHSDSQILLASANQRLGLEILDQSSKTLNAAFQKLYRWTQREFKSLDLENPQLSASIRRSLHLLAERPSLFQSCLDFFADAREHVLSANFYSALTGEAVDASHPATGKAIELSAHEPLRYVSDMLAWAHSATVSERETLEPLFLADGESIAASLSSGLAAEPWSRATTTATKLSTSSSALTSSDEEDDGAPEPFNPTAALQTLLDRTLTSVFRQLRQRTEQVLSSHPSAPLAYRIANLLSFYTTIFAPLLAPTSTLLTSTLHPLTSTALRAFKFHTSDHLANLSADLGLPPPVTNLTPPDYLLETLTTLPQLLDSLTSTTPSPAPEAVETLLQATLDPYLSALSTQSSSLPSPASEIYVLNALALVQRSLAPYPAALRARPLDSEIVTHVTALEKATERHLIWTSGLSALLSQTHTASDLDTFYTNPAQLLAAARALDNWLPTATEDARTFLGQLADKALVGRIVEDAAEGFVGTFEAFEALVVDADGKREEVVGERRDDGEEDDGEGGVWLRDVFPRTGDEIRVLLS